MITLIFLLLLVPHHLASLQVSHQLSLEPLPDGTIFLSSTAELSKEFSPSLSASIGITSGGEAEPIPWEFSHLSCTYSHMLLNSFSHELSSTLQFSFRRGSNIEIRKTLDGSYKTPPVSHMVSASAAMLPPYGWEYQLSFTMLQAVSASTGISVFTVLGGAVYKPLMKGTPGITKSSLRTGFRSSFVFDNISHHLSCSFHLSSPAAPPRIQYLFIARLHF